MGTVVPFATKFLAGDFTDFDQREAAVRPPAPGPVVKTTAAGTASDEVEGWRALFEQRNFSRAAASFEAVSTRLADAEREHRGFWKYMEAFAEYLRHVFDEQPGALQVSLGHLESAILEGGSSSWFNRLRKAKNTLAGKAEPVAAPDQSAVLDRWDELVEKYPHFKGRFLKWQAALRAYFDGTHNQVCAALQSLGHLLGFIATRPAGSGVADGIVPKIFDGPPARDGTSLGQPHPRTEQAGLLTLVWTSRILCSRTPMESGSGAPPGCDMTPRLAWSSPAGAHRAGAVQLTRRRHDRSIDIK